MFTQVKDYETAISTDNLEVLINDNCLLLRKIEESVKSQIKSFVSHRYDTEEMFKGFSKYKDDKEYISGEMVVFPENEDEIFISAIDANIGNTPIPSQNSAEWVLGDNRHKYLLMLFIDMVIFHAHRTIEGRKIPEHRISMYDEAVQWFKDVNAEKITPNFPRLAPDPLSGRTNIIFGSSKGTTNTY